MLFLQAINYLGLRPISSQIIGNNYPIMGLVENIGPCKLVFPLQAQFLTIFATESGQLSFTTMLTAWIRLSLTRFAGASDRAGTSDGTSCRHCAGGSVGLRALTTIGWRDIRGGSCQLGRCRLRCR